MIVRKILAVIAGFVVGSIVNMALITIGSSVIPAPPGVDVSDAESIAQSLHLYEFRHFVFPFLAHAAGTLAGGLIGGYIAWQHRASVVIIIAALFFAGGVIVSFMIPAPVGFLATDLILAYFPMAVIALWVLNRLSGNEPANAQ